MRDMDPHGDNGGGGRGPRDPRDRGGGRRDDDEPRGLRELMSFLEKLHDATTRRLDESERRLNESERLRVEATTLLCAELQEQRCRIEALEAATRPRANQ